MSTLPSTVEWVSYTLLAFFILTFWLNREWGNPAIAILNRWVRWVLFANTVAILVTSQEWTDRPYWVLLTTGFLGWFLVETIYNWVYIRALSFSEIPLFPHYREAEKNEWPVNKRLIEAKTWLKDSNFSQKAFLKAELGPEIFLRNAIYESEDKQTRVQLIFLPQIQKQIFPYYVVTSMNDAGKRFISNNLPMPYGGTYPENWTVQRKPLIRSLEQLLKVHDRALKVAEFTRDEFSVEPLYELNEQQRFLERTNVDQGFLHAREYRDDYGTLSNDGRYRLWKEIWLMNYLGRTIA